MCPPRVLLLLALPLLAADEAVPLSEAVEQLERRQEDHDKKTIESLYENLEKHATEAGDFADKTIETRKELLRSLARREELLADVSSLLLLRKQLGKKAAGKKPPADWLAEAKPRDRVTPQSASPALGDYDYSAIDKHVAAAPAEAGRSIKTLAAYLAQGAKNDREKARAIARWMLDHFAYDWDSVGQKNLESDPEKILTSRAAQCNGQALVFEALAKAGGLEARTVFGRGKLMHIDDVFRSTAEFSPLGIAYGEHAWNALKIDGHWYIQDVTVCNTRRKLRGRIESGGEPTWDWFLVPPHLAVHGRWPRQEKDQLLEKAVKRADHERLPLLTPRSAAYGVEPISHPGPLLTMAGEAVLTFRVAEGVELFGGVADDRANAYPPGHASTRRVGGEVKLRVSVPKAGTHLLRVFARKADGGQTFDPVIEYRIEATTGKGKPNGPEVSARGHDRGAVPYLPRTATLTAGKKVRFLVHLPKATTAGVYCAGSERFVELTGKDGFFAGEVEVTAGVVLVSAKQAGDRQFSHLIAYRAQ